MEYQFVFGNPIQGIAKKENPSKIKRKGSHGMKKKKKAASKSNPRKKTAKRRNPYVWSGISASGRRTKGKRRWFTEAEMEKMADKLLKAKQQLNAGPNKPKTTKTLTKRIAKLENWIKSQNFRIADASKERETKFAGKGLSIEPYEVGTLQGKSRKKGKKKVAKKKTKKKSHKKAKKSVKSALPKGYQKWPKKGIKMTKKLKRARRKRVAAKYAIGKGKKQRRYSIRRNPMGLALSLPQSRTQVESFVGNLGELTSLTLGGLTYGMVQQYALKFFPGIFKFAEKIPVLGPIVGPAFPTLLVGVILHKVGDMRNIAPLKMVGKGLLGASVVGMSMSAAKQIMPMSGIPEGLGEADFEGVEAFSGIPEGLGYEQVSLGEEADFEGVEAFSGADFEGVEAFAGIPEGLGYGQLG